MRRIALGMGFWLVCGIFTLSAEDGNPIAELTDLEKKMPQKEGSLLPAAKKLETGSDPKAESKAKGEPDFPTIPDRNRNDPFIFRSRDGQSSLRFIGLMQSEYRGYLKGPDTTDIDTFQLRRARLGLEATLYEQVTFRFVSEFGQNQVRILDGYGDLKIDEGLHFRAGKFRQPFGYELYAVTNRRAPFLERSMLDPVSPNRDVGAMFYGDKLFEDRFDYALSLTNGNFGSDIDGDDRKELVGRVAVRPFRGKGERECIDTFQVGLSGSTDVNQTAVTTNPVRTAFGVPWLQFNNGVRLDGLRNRIGPELAFFEGSFGFAAQYLYLTQEMRPAGTIAVPLPKQVTVSANGFYFLASYLLTGEQRTGFDQWIDPIRPLNPMKGDSGWGAFEVVTRLERLEFDRVIFAPRVQRLADPLAYTSAATTGTLGVNWYWNRFTRLSAHFEQSWFDDPVRFAPGPGGLSKNSSTLLMRLQVTF